MKHDKDLVCVEGVGVCTRAQAREAAVQYAAKSGELAATGKSLDSIAGLMIAYNVASQAPAYKPYNPVRLSFFD